MCSSKTELMANSNVCAYGLWNALPDILIAKLYTYLSLKDRVSASMVCKSWSRGFQTPKLWKSIKIWLNGDPGNVVKKISDSREKVIGSMGSLLVISQEKDINDTEATPEPESGSEASTHASSHIEPNTNPIDLKNVSAKDEICFFPTLEFSDEKALEFASRYGRFVKNLHLMCDPMSKALSENLKVKVSRFLKSLLESSCELHELIIFFSYNANDWEENAKQGVVAAFAEFISFQRRLKTLIFGNSFYNDDVHLLEVITKNCGTTLKEFHCLFYNDKDSSSSGNFHERYCRVLGQIPNIQYIGMSAQSLSDSIITTLNNCRKLRTVYLYDLTFSRDMPWRPVREATCFKWKKPLRIHPKIERRLGGEFWLNRPLLPQFVPFTMNIYGNAQFRFEHYEASIPKAVLQTLRKYFSRNLVSLNFVDGPDMLNGLKEAVRELVISCVELKELNANVSIEFLEELFNLQRHNVIDLQSFTFRCVDYSPSDLIQLKNLLQKNQDLLSQLKWCMEICNISFRLMENNNQTTE